MLKNKYEHNYIQAHMHFLNYKNYVVRINHLCHAPIVATKWLKILLSFLSDAYTLKCFIYIYELHASRDCEPVLYIY